MRMQPDPTLSCGQPACGDCLINHLGERDVAEDERCAQCGLTLDELDGQANALGGQLKISAEEANANTTDLPSLEEKLPEIAAPSSPTTAAEAVSHSAVSRSAESGAPRRLGSYQIEELLGRGGMGAVYRATHGHLQKPVAIKMLPRELLNSEAAEARFRREMVAVGRLDHPNVVCALDGGATDGVSYLVMELVIGVDLGRIAQRGKPLDVAVAAELVRQAADGLQYAHGQGLIHRDVKPANLMLTQDANGQPIVKVMDLGLARLVELDSTSTGELTVHGQVMGTLEFMAPEQATPGADVDHRADIYALGATLFRLLTGRLPFDGPNYSNAVHRLHGLTTESAPSIGGVRDDLPPELIALVDRMLALEPQQRPQSMQEVAEALAPLGSPTACSQLLAADADESSKAETLRSREELAETVRQLPAVEDAPPSTTPATAPLRQPAALPAPRKQRPRWSLPVALGAMGLAALLVWGVIVLLAPTKHGVLRIEIRDPSIEISVSGEDRFRVKGGDKEFEIEPGEHTLKIRSNGLTFTSKSFTVDKNEKTVLRVQLLDGKRLQLVDGDQVIDERVVQPEKRPPRSNPSEKIGPDNSHLATRRELTKWIIERKGHVFTTRDLSSRVAALEEIPDGPFEIAGVQLQSATAEAARELIDMLTQIPECRMLILSGSEVTDESVAGVGRLKQLVHFDLQCDKVTDRSVRQWSTMPKLRSLNLQWTSISGEGLAHLAKVCPNVTTFGYLTRTLPDNQFRRLVLFSKLEDLDLNVPHVSAEMLEPLRSLKLSYFSIRAAERVDTEALEVLSKLPLPWLSFQTIALTDAHLDLLVGMERLEKLELSGTKVTAEGIAKFRAKRPNVETRGADVR